jgi:16S rRNA (adenine1518-N6/adenine1519-N6)-dimethyltransferase
VSSGFEHPAKVLERLGISPRKSLSQNFLQQPKVAREIVARAPWPRTLVAVEVGAGTGVLTDAIAGAYERVVAIEFDRTLAEHLRRRYEGTHVSIVEGDARAIALADVAAGPLVVFGNLPYAITTELILAFIRQRAHLAGAVIMVQREYADRLGARPRTKAYGSLSVFASFHLRIVDRLRVGAGAFFPPPDVGSSVLVLEFHDPPDSVDTEVLERLVRAAFSHRRKMVRSNLATALGLPLEAVSAALEQVAGSATVRAEELSPERYVRLAAALGARR